MRPLKKKRILLVFILLIIGFGFYKHVSALKNKECPSWFFLQTEASEYLFVSQKNTPFFETLFKKLKTSNFKGLFSNSQIYDVYQKKGPFYTSESGCADRTNELAEASCPDKQRVVIRWKKGDEEIFSLNKEHTYGLKKASLYYLPEFTDEYIFTKSTDPLSYLYLFFNELKHVFKKHMYYLNAYGINTMEESDIVLSLWKTHQVDFISFNRNTFLFLFESPVDLKIERNETYDAYRKVFTYDHRIVDGKKYIFSLLPYAFENTDLVCFPKEKSKLIAFVATNFDEDSEKVSLYPMRREVIKWFLENHPDDIEIYGRGWENLESQLSPMGQRSLLKCNRGIIDDKIKALLPIRFTLVLENASHPGYISEKIFDAMKAGSVPIYYGAPNVTDYIPADTFIDYRNFSSLDELYDFVKNMPEDVYQTYLNNIQTFIQDFDKTPFYYKTVARILEKHIFSEEAEFSPAVSFEEEEL